MARHYALSQYKYKKRLCKKIGYWWFSLAKTCSNLNGIYVIVSLDLVLQCYESFISYSHGSLCYYVLDNKTNFIALIVLSALTACVLVGAIVIVKRNVSKYKKIANLYEENRTRMYTEVRWTDDRVVFHVFLLIIAVIKSKH